jgi:hypothetical protein
LTLLTFVLVLFSTWLAACAAFPTTPPATATTEPPPTEAFTATNTPSPQSTAIPENLVWFGPNMGSRDFVDMFTDPDAWSHAQASMDVFRFHSSVLFTMPCAICGDNYLQPFVDADAFRKLADWGIGIGIEVGALYENGCDGERNYWRDAGVVILNVERNGGKVAFLAMDEPLLHGGNKPIAGACNYSLEEAADETAIFVKTVQTYYPEIIVGDTEPYPHYSVAQLEDWILELESNGISLPFFHLDVDIERVRVEAQDVTADLQELKRFCDERGIAFGVIFTSNWTQASSDRDYYLSTMSWLEMVKEAIGRPNHIIFESWQGPSPNGLHEVPLNLPANDPDGYSHIDLLMDGLQAFGN